jgi:hypothetical protein
MSEEHAAERAEMSRPSRLQGTASRDSTRKRLPESEDFSRVVSSLDTYQTLVVGPVVGVCPVLEVRVGEVGVASPGPPRTYRHFCELLRGDLFQRLLARSTLCKTVQTGSCVAVRLQYKAPDKLPGLYRSLAFYLQIYIILSGAEGDRTPALRLAKSKPLHRRRSSLFKNTCK